LAAAFALETSSLEISPEAIFLMASTAAWAVWATALADPVMVV